MARGPGDRPSQAPVLLEYRLRSPTMVELYLQLSRGTPRSEPADVNDSILIDPRVVLAADRTGETP